MESTIPLPQQILTRFLTHWSSRRVLVLDSNICNMNHASSTHRLTHLNTSLSHPLHHPLSLRCRFLLLNTTLSSLLRTCPSSLRPSFSSMTTPQAQSSSDPPQSKTVRVVIKGRVQGVFYRNWTIENAKQLGLKGWVRNRRDGYVEALFSGNSDSVHEMEQRCRRGPPDAMVTGLEVFPCNDDPGTGFQRKPTV